MDKYILKINLFSATVLPAYFTHWIQLNIRVKSHTKHTYLASVVLGDHEHLTIQSRLTHCTIQSLLTLAISAKCGNSGAQFMRWGICVRAVPHVSF